MSKLGKGDRSEKGEKLDDRYKILKGLVKTHKTETEA